MLQPALAAVGRVGSSSATECRHSLSQRERAGVREKLISEQ